MKGLTTKQREFLAFIEKFSNNEGMAPTVYEIADQFGIKTSTVFAHLQALQKKGYLTRSSKARSISLSKKVSNIQGDPDSSPMVEIPLIGRVCAGLPVDSPELREGTISCDPAFLGGNISNLFALTVTGESMREIGILDGDVVIAQQTHNIRRGDVVVALVENQTTVKSYFPAADAKIELRPANPEFKSQFYPLESVTIQGKIVSLQRKY
jgi:repressor LexA